MIKAINGKFNVSKLTPSDLTDIVGAFWIPELEANGFTWNQEHFVTLFLYVKI